MGLVDLPATYHQNFTIQMHHIMSHNICHYVQPKHYHPKAPSGYICQKLTPPKFCTIQYWIQPSQ